FFIKPFLDVLEENKIPTLCFDLDYTLKGTTNILEERLNTHFNWMPIEHLLKKRGQKAGRINISDKDVKENTDFSTIKKLSKALAKGDLKMKDVPTIKPVFRLSPPRKGFRSLKNPYNRRGDLGYRGEAINQLISRMA
ncbi:MAG: 50S ribosomal protein L30, partial [Candidatus Heimdallarchaeota archaeon]|nr:50S ribosomal protein L30 [Candidatus Heimdallarchaeota archaeon]